MPLRGGRDKFFKNQKMKNLLFSLVILLFSACTKDFENINSNPAAAENIPPEYLFSTAILQASLDVNASAGLQMAYSACLAQQLASTKFNWQGDKYYQDPIHSEALFNRAYLGDIRNLSEVIFLTENRPEKANLRAMARILRALVMQRLTDTYGDVPYFEAGQGFRKTIFEPKYDAQQAIYADILKELDEACQSLDPAKPGPGDADFIFKGDAVKWRRFGYSLMLRAAMRLTKVDAGMAETWAKKALAGGIMADAADEALVPHTSGPADINKNGIGQWLVDEKNGRLCQTFTEWLAARHDPRLEILSYVPAGSAPLGLPHGTDDLHFGQMTGVFTLDSFSTINPKLTRLDSPTPLQTLAEVQFLAAEATLRGWNAGGDAAIFYATGVREAMHFWAKFDASLAVPDSTVAQYLTENPLPGDAPSAIQTVNEQYWAATFLNGAEAWANWRRSGFPVLVPANYQGNVTGGVTPRRLQYPLKEFSVNARNVGEAVARQGADLMTTRVWWDKL